VVDEGFGFMATRGVGGGLERRGGFVWDDGRFHLLDHVEVRTDYTPVDHFHERVHAVLRSGDRTWAVEGRALSIVPLRNRQPAASSEGAPGLLRISKAPTKWKVPGDLTAFGMTEYHDQMEDGIPAGLAE
jgi:hypothetical protein